MRKRTLLRDYLSMLILPAGALLFIRTLVHYGLRNWRTPSIGAVLVITVILTFVLIRSWRKPRGSGNRTGGSAIRVPGEQISTSEHKHPGAPAVGELEEQERNRDVHLRHHAPHNG